MSKKPRVLIPIELVKVGEPTINKRVYSEEVIQKLVETGGKLAKEGRLWVEDRRDTNRNDELMDLNKVVGVAKDVHQEGDTVIGTIEILVSRSDGIGEVVKLLAESGQGRFFPIGKGTVKIVDGVPTVQADYKMTGIGFEYNSDYQGEIVQVPEVELDLNGKNADQRAANLARGMAKEDARKDAEALGINTEPEPEKEPEVEMRTPPNVPLKPTLVDKDELNEMIDTALEAGATFRDPPIGQTFVADAKYPEKAEDAEPEPQLPEGEAKKLAEFIANAPTAKVYTAKVLPEPEPIGRLIEVPAIRDFHDFDSPCEQSIREMASQPVEPEPEPEAEPESESEV